MVAQRIQGVVILVTVEFLCSKASMFVIESVYKHKSSPNPV
ncbi:hypothetical protein VCRA2120O332_20274 [Vibrio crassostreae]|nr:hypothetical protein FB441_0723 [Vibrio crassostreae]CAK2475462.1 hypothetical protein VCRA2114E327_30272 [Vibrio crassostreae]CAK3482815.1 hypothetical protein VCRA2120O332_20274 [Vibrio crassostreae]